MQPANRSAASIRIRERRSRIPVRAQCPRPSNGHGRYACRDRLALSLVVTLVVKENVDQEKDAGPGGGEEKKNRESWITPDSERGLDAHQHRGTDNQRGDD